MISVVWCARCRSFSVWLLNASVIIRVITSGMVRGRGALDGKRFTTYIVFSGSGLSCSAPITLRERRVVEQPAVPVRHLAPTRRVRGGHRKAGRQAAAGGDVLGGQRHLLAVEAIELAGDQVRRGQDQPRRPLAGRAREVFGPQLLEVDVLRQRPPERAGFVEAGPVPEIQDVDARGVHPRIAEQRQLGVRAIERRRQRSAWSGPPTVARSSSRGSACLLPASTVALMAPIDTPDTTSGVFRLSISHSITRARTSPSAPPPCSTSPVIMCAK